MKNFYKKVLESKRRRTFSMILSLCMFFLGMSTVIAQVSLYSFSQSNGTFTPINGVALGTASANTTAENLNSNIYTTTIPFQFNYNGTFFSSVNVSTNGFITFGTTLPSATTSSPISSSLGFDGVISIFGRDISSFFDINGLTGSILTETVGSAPNREFVIEWRNFRPNSSSSSTDVYSMSFQIRLKETVNTISFVYGNNGQLIGSTSSSSTAQIGLRGATNTDFNNRLSSSTTLFSNSVVGTANSSSQNYSTTSTSSGMPPSGLTYIWSPPTCYPPSNVTVNGVTANSANVQWSAPLNVPASGYQVYYSLSSTDPNASTVPSQTGITATSTNLPSLTPGTVYYVWVRSSCGSSDFSDWTPGTQFVTSCQPPALLSTTGATICSGATAVLNATADAGATLNWYDAATGGTFLGTGTSFTTPTLVNTTNYYVTAANVSTYNAGKQASASTSGYTLAAGLFFDALQEITIEGVYVYPKGTGAGTVTIALQNGGVSPATTLQTITVDLTGTAEPYVKTYVPLNFVVPAGTNYKLMMMSRTGGVAELLRESGSSWGAYPLAVPGVISITNGNCCSGNTTSSSYYFFYDWVVKSACESPRQQVTATVDAAGCLATAEVAQKENFKIHPNPFTDFVNIQNVDKVKSISVIDGTGRLVKSNIKVSESINLSDLKSGMYLLNLELKDGTKVSHKIMKK